MPGLRARTGIAVAAYGIVVGAIWIGFALGSSRAPWLLGYSKSYLVFLVVLAVTMMVPPLVLGLGRRLGWRKLLSETAPSLLVLAAVGLLSARVYYARQEHRFDPFLQSPPRPVEAIEAPRPPGVVRIAALGGSTTEGMEGPQVDGYPARLESLLRHTEPGLQIEVLNAGHVWWTTKHSMIYYVTQVRRWRPDVVLVLHAVNDLYRSCSPAAFALGEYRDDWSHFYGPAINGARPPSFLRFVLGTSLRRMYLHWYSRWRIHEVDYPLERYRSLAPFERNLEDLVGLIAADGAVPVLITQPALYRLDLRPEERALIRFGEEFCLTETGWLTAEYPSVASLRVAMDAFNDTIRRVARENGTRLVDLDAEMPRNLEMLADDVHYTDAGVDFVSARVAARIDELVANLSAR